MSALVILDPNTCSTVADKAFLHQQIVARSKAKMQLAEQSPFFNTCSTVAIHLIESVYTDDSIAELLGI